MKRILAVFLASAALALCLTADTGATGCAVVVRAPVVYAAPVYHAPAYVAPALVAVPAPYPVYSVTYGSGDAAVNALRAEIQQLKGFIQGMAAAGQRLPQPQAAPNGRGVEEVPAPARQAAPAEGGFLRQDCAKCHTGASAKGGFTLFAADGRVSLSPEQLGDAIIAVNGTFGPDGKFIPPTMPKNVQVPAERRIMYTAELTRLGAQAAAPPDGKK